MVHACYDLSVHTNVKLASTSRDGDVAVAFMRLYVALETDGGGA